MPSLEAVPSQRALEQLLAQETADEIALVRRGEEHALARINHLKAVSASRERNLALLNASMVAQHELLADVTARLTALTRALPSPQACASLEPPWNGVARDLHNLHARLAAGAGAVRRRE